ncbi:hypothetical protein H310_08079 [Aphanomyces invadans]|uniref:Uncharacterized protein n=1 Tax=Aphanomyces invadans TaxID=157072 RepID=A0A024U0G3_9STRA|nr:hypothetical protein H310_08079 [Aphanomyces invadans]ETV99366.1 hypothetical protein H310_08079 [Aphanomyces invadans]|eukprot:XP_008871922.1 hypothetical protein H310_08079 [Aphanomyces invadans]
MMRPADEYASVQDDTSARKSFAAVTTPIMEDDGAMAPLVVDNLNPPLSTPPKKKRVACLDVFRGVTITVMIFVNLGGGGLDPFIHVGWNGLHPADCVFPFFAWIMGVTMNVGMASHAKKGTAPLEILLGNFVRSVKLFLLGLFVNNFRNLKTGRITGVLQSFGFAYLAVSVGIVVGLHWKSDVRTWQHRLIEGAVIAALVTTNLLITFLLSVPGCPTSNLGNEIEACGPHYYVDKLVFGDSHLYSAGNNDPEGLLNWLMVAFTAYIGYVVGGFFLATTEWKRKVAILMGAGIVLGLVGLGLAGFQVEGGPIPVNKSIWSVSFVLTVSGMACVVLCVFYLIVDKFAWWHGMPFKETGMNAIALYVGHEVVGQHAPFGWDRDEDVVAQNVLSNLGGTLCWVMIAIWMFKHEYFITV